MVGWPTNIIFFRMSWAMDDGRTDKIEKKLIISNMAGVRRSAPEMPSGIIIHAHNQSNAQINTTTT